MRASSILFRHPGLYLEAVESKGVGLFCCDDIGKDSVIEAAPAVIFNDADAAHIDKTKLYNYYFEAPPLSEDKQRSDGITNSSKAGCMVMGVLSFCNHADTPNAAVEKTEQDGQIVFILKALRAIPAKTEILISYGRTWFKVV